MYLVLDSMLYVAYIFLPFVVNTFHQCPGRYLAMHIIRMTVIFTIYSFDVQLSAVSDRVLRHNPLSFSPWLKTANDLVIRVSRRSGLSTRNNIV